MAAPSVLTRQLGCCSPACKLSLVAHTPAIVAAARDSTVMPSPVLCVLRLRPYPAGAIEIHPLQFEDIVRSRRPQAGGALQQRIMPSQTLSDLRRHNWSTLHGPAPANAR